MTIPGGERWRVAIECHSILDLFLHNSRRIRTSIVVWDELWDELNLGTSLIPETISVARSATLVPLEMYC
jgi:hypothetical protein